jgi:hypothetical protein
LVAADGFRPCAGGFFLDGRREGTGGERISLRLSQGECVPLGFESLPSDLNRVLELGVDSLGISSASALQRLVGWFIDGGLWGRQVSMEGD